MLYQKYDTELDNKCSTIDDKLTCFVKARQYIVGNIKELETPTYQRI